MCVGKEGGMEEGEREGGGRGREERERGKGGGRERGKIKYQECTNGSLVQYNDMLSLLTE